MPDPHLICVACEQAEATLQQPFCAACQAQLLRALVEGAVLLVGAVPKVQIGPTDI